MTESISEGVAIIGMTGRFPGAANVDLFWRNLIAGVESISTFTDEELAATGCDVAALKKEPGYIAARGVLRHAEWFDAAFFGLIPKEAEIIDPQQRLFLEAAWEALEHAGYDPERFQGLIGVYAGVGNSTYFLNNLHSRSDVVNSANALAVLLGNEKDFLATRTAYKLNLKGPAINVNTACSTSLVAVCQAVQSLLNFQCDIALAGGVSIHFPQQRAYHYQEGGIVSPDGHCRTFDAQARGTVPSDGLGIVVLKRLAEALDDGDEIHAVIKGIGLNNDGSSKVSFTSPSVDGQAEVIALAQAQAGFDPATISYVEAHGTATPLGDPIEIAGLTQAFGKTATRNFCAIGSVKTNIGHLDAAAGVAGLIKTVLALKYKVLPPSLHFERPNPRIDFANTPFFVNSRLIEWKPGPTPRRAGVSSFGLGGTNAHVVLEEAPPPQPSSSARDWKLLVLSGKTGTALDAATINLLTHLKENPKIDLADAACTLQIGRAAFHHRRMLVCRSADDAIQALQALDSKRVSTQRHELKDPSVVFMFPGQGAQYINMGAGLYNAEPVFKAEVDRCAELLLPHLGLDLRQVLFSPPEQMKLAEELLVQTRMTQPALFVIEFALARLWMSWGVRPRAMIGHSVGEYVAGCLAGVFTLEEALGLVAARAGLIQSQPGGAMLAIRLTEKELLPLLPDRLSLAAVNSSSACVVSGPHDAVDTLERLLGEKSVAARRLQTSHAFHSAMMDPVIGPFTELLQKLKLSEPAIPYVSNVTAKWITPAEATNPKYWAGHVRQTVRFADGVAELLKNPQNILLEVGPGQALSALARQHPALKPGRTVLASFNATKDQSQEAPSMLNALGKLWLAGVSVDWAGFYAHEKRRRIPLPTYPFERKRFWVEPAARIASPPVTEAVSSTTVAASAVVASPPEVNGSIGLASLTCAPVEIPSRKDRILAMLMVQLQELSGTNLAGLAPSVTFTEMGFDSLFLAQASQNVERKFGVKVAFRQLLEDLPTLNDLAAHLDQKLPLEALPVALSPQMAPTIFPTMAAGSANPALDAIHQQLQAVARQLDTLRQTGPPMTSPMVPLASVENSVPLQTGVVLLEPASVTESAVNASTLPDEDSHPLAQVLNLPLTEAQMELWAAAQLGEDALRAFSQIISIQLRGPLKLNELRQALQELVDRHGALRTCFLPDGSAQRVFSMRKLDVPLLDFSSSSDEESVGQLAQITAAEEKTPFDLVNGPLVRVQIIKLSATHHVLLLAIHHLIMDGWSIKVVLHELDRIYPAKIQGVLCDLLPATQYGDYIRWQNAPENRAKFAEAETYWMQQFANLPSTVELPTDRPRPAAKTYGAATQGLSLDSALYLSLKSAAAKEGCTLFTYLLGSFYIWLQRLTGQDDLAVGVPAAGQIVAASQQDFEGRSLVGHCVNLLPIRCRCEGDPCFKDYLKTIKGVVLDAHEHQQFTFGNLVKKLNPPRDPSRAPLISMTFNVARAAAGFHWPGIGSEISFPPKSFNFFDLTFDLMDSDEDLRIECRFNTDLFEAGTIQRWLGHWKTLLEAMAANPAQTISALPMLNESERRQLLVEWNDTQRDFPQDQCLHQLFEAQAKHSPDAAAVIFEDQCLNYHELNQRANQLAHHLKTEGVGPETLVGVYMERSLEMLVGLLGILKAGGAYVPLDPNFPPERLKFILEDARVTVLLTQPSLLKELPKLAPSANEGHGLPTAKIICADRAFTSFDNQSKINPDANVQPRDLAYVLYTSGSTGNPKGVQISHRALVNFLTSMKREPGLTAADILLAVTTLSFDIAGLELWLPLVVGARVVIARADVAMDGRQLAAQLAESKATVMQATPATWRMLLEAGWAGDPRLKILCGGEAWSEELARQLLSRCGSLWNMYGPTETTIWSAVAKVEGPQVPSIGRPVANTRFYVLDARLQPVPVDVSGELHIGGDGLARGYLNRPELTAEKFIPDPFTPEPGARLYKTGDLVRYRPDGRIEFLSRMDNQVKIRGFRIELGDVEAALRQHPNLRDLVVMARENAADIKQLAAYVVARQAPAPTAVELRRFLKEKLPDYMVPSSFVLLDALPLTPNGKVDRKALPAPQGQLPDSAFVPPKTPAEIAVAKIWCDILGLEQVGLHDDFFELGGHSLMATKLISRLETFHGVEARLRDIFDAPTVAAMSKWLESKQNSGKTSTPPANSMASVPTVATP